MDILNNKISILGCGWFGLELAKKLIENGFSVKGSTTSADKLQTLQKSGILPYLINFSEKEEHFEHSFFDCSVLVISIPPKRSTAEQHTFVSKIEKISKVANINGVRQIIFISSTSVYGDKNEEVNESTLPYPNTDSGKAILQAEQLLRNNHDFSTTVIRFGGLIGPNRDPARFFAGKKDIPNGKAPVNLIHLSDCIGISLSIIEQQAYGHIYNACATDHPSREMFYTNAALKSKLEEPSFINELLDWKIVKSDMVLKQLAYEFKVSLNSLVTQ